MLKSVKSIKTQNTNSEANSMDLTGLDPILLTFCERSFKYRNDSKAIVNNAIAKNLNLEYFNHFCQFNGFELVFKSTGNWLFSLVSIIVFQLDIANGFYTAPDIYQIKCKKTYDLLVEEIDIPSQLTIENVYAIIPKIMKKLDNKFEFVIDFVGVNESSIYIQKPVQNINNKIFANFVAPMLPTFLTESANVKINLWIIRSNNKLGTIAAYQDIYRNNKEDYIDFLINKLTIGNMLGYYIRTILKKVELSSYENFAKNSIRTVLAINTINEIKNKLFVTENYFHYLEELFSLEKDIPEADAKKLTVLLKKSISKTIIEQLAAAFEDILTDCKKNLINFYQEQQKRLEAIQEDSSQLQNLQLNIAVDQFKLDLINFLANFLAHKNNRTALKNQIFGESSFENFVKYFLTLHNQGFPKTSQQLMKFYSNKANYQALIIEFKKIFSDQQVRMLGDEKSGVCEISGNYVYLEQKLIQNGLKEIYIFAGSSIFITGNIICPGINISLDANENIIIDDEYTINTSGKDGNGYLDDQKNTVGAMHGEDGKHGKTGQHAGDITIKCKQLIGREKLALIANGGSGFSGTNGSNGKAGTDSVNGADGTAKEKKIPMFTCGHTLAKGTKASDATRGGNGGEAGLGGMGGDAGLIILKINGHTYTDTKPSPIKSHNRISGKKGLDGKPGEGGIGGNPGKHGLDDSYTGGYVNCVFGRNKKKGLKLELHEKKCFWDPYEYKSKVSKQDYHRKRNTKAGEDGNKGTSDETSRAYPNEKYRNFHKATNQIQTKQKQQKQKQSNEEIRVLQKRIAQQKRAYAEKSQQQQNLELEIAKGSELAASIHKLEQECQGIITQGQQQVLEQQQHVVLGDSQKYFVNKDKINTNLLYWRYGQEPSAIIKLDYSDINKILQGHLNISWMSTIKSIFNEEILEDDLLKIVAAYMLANECDVTLTENLLEQLNFMMRAKANNNLKTKINNNILQNVIEAMLNKKFTEAKNKLASIIEELLEATSDMSEILEFINLFDDSKKIKIQFLNQNKLLQYLRQLKTYLPSNKLIRIYNKALSLDESGQPKNQLAKIVHDSSIVNLIEKKITGVSCDVILRQEIKKFSKIKPKNRKNIKLLRYDLEETTLYYHYFSRECLSKQFPLDKAIFVFNQKRSIENFFALILVFANELKEFANSKRGIYGLYFKDNINEFLKTTIAIFVSLEEKFNLPKLNEFNLLVKNIISTLKNYSDIFLKLKNELVSIKIVVQLQIECVRESNNKTKIQLLSKPPSKSENSWIFEKATEVFSFAKKIVADPASLFNAQINCIYDQVAQINTKFLKKQNLSDFSLISYHEAIKSLILSDLENDEVKNIIENCLEQLDMFISLKNISTAQKFNLLFQYHAVIASLLDKNGLNANNLHYETVKLNWAIQATIELDLKIHHTDLEQFFSNILQFEKIASKEDVTKYNVPALLITENFSIEYLKKYCLHLSLIQDKCSESIKICGYLLNLLFSKLISLNLAKFHSLSIDANFKKQIKNNLLDNINKIRINLAHFKNYNKNLTINDFIATIEKHISLITPENISSIFLSINKSVYFDLLGLGINQDLRVEKGNLNSVYFSKLAAAIFFRNVRDEIDALIYYIKLICKDDRKQTNIDILTAVFSQIIQLRDFNFQYETRKLLLAIFDDSYVTKYQIKIQQLANKNEILEDSKKIQEVLSDDNHLLEISYRKNYYEQLVKLYSKKENLKIVDNISIELKKFSEEVCNQIIIQNTKIVNEENPELTQVFKVSTLLSLVNRFYQNFLSDQQENIQNFSLSLSNLLIFIMIMPINFDEVKAIFRNIFNLSLKLRSYPNNFPLINILINDVLKICQQQLARQFSVFLQNKIQFCEEYLLQSQKEKELVFEKFSQAIINDEKINDATVILDRININLSKIQILMLIKKQREVTNFKQEENIARAENTNFSEKNLLNYVGDYLSETASSFIQTASSAKDKIQNKLMIKSPIIGMQNNLAKEICKMIKDHMITSKVLDTASLKFDPINLGTQNNSPIINDPIGELLHFIEFFIKGSNLNIATLQELAFYTKYFPILHEPSLKNECVRIIQLISQFAESIKDAESSSVAMQIMQNLTDIIEPKCDLILESIRKRDIQWNIFTKQILEDFEILFCANVKDLEELQSVGIISIVEYFNCVQRIQDIFQQWFLENEKSNYNYREKINESMTAFKKAKIWKFLQNNLNSDLKENNSIEEIFKAIINFINRNVSNQKSIDILYATFITITEHDTVFTPVANLNHIITLFTCLNNVVIYLEKDVNITEIKKNLLIKISVAMSVFLPIFIQSLYKIYLESQANLSVLNIILQFNYDATQLLNHYIAFPQNIKNFKLLYQCSNCYFIAINSQIENIDFSHLRASIVNSLDLNINSEFETLPWWISLLNEIGTNVVEKNEVQILEQLNLLETVIRFCKFNFASIEDVSDLYTALCLFQSNFNKLKLEDKTLLTKKMTEVVSLIKISLLGKYINNLNDIELELLNRLMDSTLSESDWSSLIAILEFFTKPNQEGSLIAYNRLIESFVAIKLVEKLEEKKILKTNDLDLINDYSFFNDSDVALLKEVLPETSIRSFISDLLNMQRFYPVSQWHEWLHDYLISKLYQLFIALYQVKINELREFIANFYHDSEIYLKPQLKSIKDGFENLLLNEENDESTENELLKAINTVVKNNNAGKLNDLQSWIKKVIHFRYNFNRLRIAFEKNDNNESFISLLTDIYQKLKNIFSVQESTLNLTYVAGLLFELADTQDFGYARKTIQSCRPHNWLRNLLLDVINDACSKLSKDIIQDKSLIDSINKKLSLITNSHKLFRLIAAKINSEARLINTESRMSLQSIDNLLNCFSKFKLKGLHKKLQNEPLANWSTVFKKIELESRLLCNGCDNEEILNKILVDLFYLEKQLTSNLYNNLLRTLTSKSSLNWKLIQLILDNYARNEWQLDIEILKKLSETESSDWEIIAKKHQNDIDLKRKSDRTFDEVLDLVTIELKDDLINSQKPLSEIQAKKLKSDFDTIKKILIIQNKLNSHNIISIDEFKQWIIQLKNSNSFDNNLNFSIAIVILGVQFLKNYDADHNKVSNFQIRPTQYIALLLFLTQSPNSRGYLAQIETGEGKTILIAMLAIIRVLLGDKHVFVITSSSDLAKDGIKATQDIFATFDINSETNCDESCSNNVKERTRRYDNNQVIYGDISSFQRDILLTRFYKMNITPDENLQHSVIVDEVDSMLLDKSDCVLYLSHDIKDLRYLRILYTEIWTYLHKPNIFYLPFTECIAAIKELIESRIMNKELHLPDYLQKFVLARLVLWVKSAYTATKMKHDDPYIVDKDVRVMDKDTGVKQKNMHWNNGLHQFLQLKHGRKLTTESLKAVFISNLSYFKNFKGNIYGLTGTLGSEADRNLLKKVYEVDFFKLPRFRYRNFHEEPGIVVTNNEQHLAAIAADVQIKETNRAVLIICENGRKVEAIKNYLENTQSDVEGLLKRSERIYSYKDDDKDLSVGTKENPLKAGDIIIATNLAGRGKDLIICEELEASGGLHVELTYLPSNIRVQDQAFGRAARQGKPGTGKKIVKNKFSLDLRALCEIRNQLEAQRIEELRLTKFQTIEMEELLLRKFTKLYQIIEEKLKSIHMAYSKAYVDIQLKGLLDRWAFWLDSLSELLKVPAQIDRNFLKNQFNTFKKEMLTIAEQDNFIKFVESPYELTRLGICFSLELKKHSLAAKCFEKVISENSGYSALAHYFTCYSLAKMHKKHDASVRMQIDKHMRRAKELFQSQISDLIIAAKNYEVSLLFRKTLGVGDPEDLFSQQCLNEAKLLGVHIDSIDKAIGRDFKLDILVQALVKGEEDDDIKAKKLFEQLIEQPDIIIQRHLNSQLKIVDQPASKELIVDNGFEQTDILFFDRFAYCKLKLIDFYNEKLQSRKNHTQISVSSDDYKLFVCDKEKFFNLLINYNLISDISGEAECRKGKLHLKCKDTPNGKVLDLPHELIIYSSSFQLLLHSLLIQPSSVEFISIDIEYSKLPFENSIQAECVQLFELLISQNAIIDFTFNISFLEFEAKWGKIKSQVRDIFTEIYKKKAPPIPDNFVDKVKVGAIDAVKKVEEFVFDNSEITQKITPLFAAIEEAIGKIKTLPAIDISTKNLEAYFKNGEIPPEIYELQKYLLDQILELSELKGFNWGALCVAFLGVAQIITGVVLETLSLGIATPIVSAIIAEGAGDIIYALNSALTDEFNWKDYGKYKAFSVFVSACTMGIGTYFAAPAKAVTCANPIGRILLNSAKEIGLAGLRGLVNYQVNKLLANLPHEVMVRFGEKLQKYLFEKADIKQLQNTSKLLMQQLFSVDEDAEITQEMISKTFEIALSTQFQKRHYSNTIQALTQVAAQLPGHIGKALKRNATGINQILLINIIFSGISFSLQRADELLMLKDTYELIHEVFTEFNRLLKAAVAKKNAAQNNHDSSSISTMQFIGNFLNERQTYLTSHIVTKVNEALLKPTIMQGINYGFSQLHECISAQIDEYTGLRELNYVNKPIKNTYRSADLGIDKSTKESTQNSKDSEQLAAISSDITTLAEVDTDKLKDSKVKKNDKIKIYKLADGSTVVSESKAAKFSKIKVNSGNNKGNNRFSFENASQQHHGRKNKGHSVHRRHESFKNRQTPHHGHSRMRDGSGRHMVSSSRSRHIGSCCQLGANDNSMFLFATTSAFTVASALIQDKADKKIRHLNYQANCCKLEILNLRLQAIKAQKQFIKKSLAKQEKHEFQENKKDKALLEEFLENEIALLKKQKEAFEEQLKVGIFKDMCSNSSTQIPELDLKKFKTHLEILHEMMFSNSMPSNELKQFFKDVLAKYENECIESFPEELKRLHYLLNRLDDCMQSYTNFETKLEKLRSTKQDLDNLKPDTLRNSINAFTLNLTLEKNAMLNTNPQTSEQPADNSGTAASATIPTPPFGTNLNPTRTNYPGMPGVPGFGQSNLFPANPYFNPNPMGSQMPLVPMAQPFSTNPMMQTGMGGYNSQMVPSMGSSNNGQATNGYGLASNVGIGALQLGSDWKKSNAMVDVAQEQTKQVGLGLKIVKQQGENIVTQGRIDLQILGKKQEHESKENTLDRQNILAVTNENNETIKDKTTALREQTASQERTAMSAIQGNMQVAAMQCSVQQFEKEIEAFKVENQRLLNENQKLQEQRNAIDNKATELERKLSTAEEKNKSLEKKITKLKEGSESKIKELEAKLAATEKKAKKAEKKVAQQQAVQPGNYAPGMFPSHNPQPYFQQFQGGGYNPHQPPMYHGQPMYQQMPPQHPQQVPGQQPQPPMDPNYTPTSPAPGY